MRKGDRLIILILSMGVSFATETRAPEQMPASACGPYSEVETRLAPLAKRLGPPRPGEWLYQHREAGQTFDQYLAADPIRRGKGLRTICLCLIGDFTPDQKRIIDLTREYVEIFFDAPVRVLKKVPLKDIPERAKRNHPQGGERQLLSTYVLNEVLLPDRPDDALAYLALTASDLWPGEGWNFVFGQASLRQRTGVWSIHRLGNPTDGKAAFQLCLRRTLATATHETGHILTMQHCTVYKCSLNGCNSLAEGDRKPLHLCPTCLRKHCWNLRVEPIAYLGRLEKFCRQHGLADEAAWYAKAIKALKKGN